MEVKNLVLDANVILNAIFVPISTSRKAMLYNKNKAKDIYIDTNIYSEVKNVLRIKLEANGISLAIDDLLSQFIREFGVKIIPRIPIATKRDEHVRSLARYVSGEILTNDQELAYACINMGIKVTTPYMTILKSISCHEGIFNTADEIFKITGLNSYAGSLYIKIDTSIPLPRENRQKFLAEIEGAFSLTIDSEYVYFIDFKGKVLLKAKLKLLTKEEVIIFSYSCESDKAVLKTLVGVDEIKYSKEIFSQVNESKKMHIGCNYQGIGQPNVMIFSFIVKPTSIGKDSFKIYLNQPQLYPNPYDEDQLDKFIEAIKVS